MSETWILNILSTFIFSSIFIIVSAINCAKKKDPNAPPTAPVAPAATPAPAAGQSAEVKKVDDLKPHVFEKNEKEKMIAEGQLKRNKHDYPTFDDVISDWDTEDDGEGGKKKKKKEKKDGESKDDGKKDEKDDKKSEKTKSKMADGGEKKGEKK